MAPATMQFSLVGSGHVIFGVSVRGGLPHLRHLGGLARLGQPVTTKGLLKYAKKRLSRPTTVLIIHATLQRITRSEFKRLNRCGILSPEGDTFLPVT